MKRHKLIGLERPEKGYFENKDKVMRPILINVDEQLRVPKRRLFAHNIFNDLRYVVRDGVRQLIP